MDTKTKSVNKSTLKNNQTRKVEAEKGTKKKSSGGGGVLCEQEDTIMKEGAQVMGRNIAKAGRQKSIGESNGLVQARIEVFLKHSGQEVVK